MPETYSGDTGPHDDVLAALKEGADKTAAGRPYHYVDGKALSCAELERLSRKREAGNESKTT